MKIELKTLDELKKEYEEIPEYVLEDYKEVLEEFGTKVEANVNKDEKSIEILLDGKPVKKIHINMMKESEDESEEKTNKLKEIKIKMSDAFKVALSVQKIPMGVLKDEVKMSEIEDKETSMYELVDALADILVFMIGRLVKNGECVNRRFNRLVEFQLTRRLDLLEYSSVNELSFTLEEAIETTGIKSEEANKLAKEAIKKMQPDSILKATSMKTTKTSIMKIVNKLTELGLDAQIVIDEVSKHILSRTGKIENGKFIKDANVKVYEPDYDKAVMVDIHF